MNRSQILEWVYKQFSPIELVTPPETIEQILENAIRFFNTHSAYKTIENVPASVNAVKVEVPLGVKLVTQVFPNQQTDYLLQNHPLWTLLGVQILDNVTSDLINVSESFKSYKIYIGNDFRWTFVDSGDPNKKSYLLLSNVPVGCTGLCVVGAKRIFSDDDITAEHILEWLLNYFLSLVKITEGRLLRVSDIIGVKNDGDALLKEGNVDKEKLEERLAKEGRWLSFSKRW